MAIFNKVLPSLAKADERLAALMTESVTKREYSHLSELASVSEKVRAAIAEIERIEPPAAAPEPAVRKRAAAPKAEAPKRRRRSPPKRGYPKYSRRGDSLVRTEWSNSKNVEQTHAVPYPTVAQIATTIVGDGGAMFRKNILTELSTPDGKQLPIHQVYLILGWLLASKAIRKKGRGDYIPNYAKLTAEALRGSFNELSEVEGK
ncbi:MAG: hypothetical protein OXE83_09625 [Gammaproteobacteria bacterium]|nr:hypothetical protein [Gammaproteobacteria bacterium]